MARRRVWASSAWLALVPRVSATAVTVLRPPQPPPPIGPGLCPALALTPTSALTPGG